MNVVAGIGMLGAGVIGGPLIGQVLDRQMVHGVAAYDAKNNTQLVETLKTERTGIFGDYTAIDPSKRATIAGDEEAAVEAAERESKHDALRTIAILPGIMFLVYLGLILYFTQPGRLQARGARPEEVETNGDIPRIARKGGRTKIASPFFPAIGARCRDGWFEVVSRTGRGVVPRRCAAPSERRAIDPPCCIDFHIDVRPILGPDFIDCGAFELT